MKNTVRTYVCLGALAASSLLGGCADEDFENAKVHKCNLERSTAQLHASPGDAALAAEVRSTSEMLRAVVEGASDPAALRAKLAEHTCP